MDKCREAFERIECEKYEANYDDMKKNWDWYESQFGYRYSPDSLRGKDWAVWQKAWQHQQAKVDELQRRNQILNDNIKEQGQKLVYQNEVIETQAEKLLGLRDEKAELQKMVDAAKYYMKNIFSGVAEVDQCHLGDLLDILDGEIVDELEQALKGEG